MIDADVGVVLPAAGCGERMNTAIPKQYLKVLDKPLFLYALEEFLSLKCVRKISLVADNVERMSGILRMYHLDESDRISVVRGSRTRHRSIKIGLHDLINSGVAVTVVIVHDAVRPFVPRDLIDELIKEALRIGAAGPVRPLVSTILKTSSDYFLEESLNRSTYRCSETPQAFQLDILLSAYNKATEEDLDFGTECLQLVLNYCDIKAKLIPTDESLWKVTYSRDLHIVEAVVREKTSDVCIISEEENEAVNFLVDNLTSKVATIKAILGGASTQTKDNGKTYNTVIILHTNEIHEDLNLLDFATLIDLDKEGLIIHIIDHSSFDSLQTMSVYNLHRNSRKMAHHYNKLHKGVVVIHCVSSNETEKLASVVSTLIQADPRTFSEVELLMLPSSAKNMKANRSVELEGGECPSAFSPASPQKETLNCSSVLMSTPNICTGEEPTPTLENVYRRKRSHQFQKTTGLEPRNVIIVKQTNFKWLQTYIFILTRYCLCMQTRRLFVEGNVLTIPTPVHLGDERPTVHFLMECQKSLSLDVYVLTKFAAPIKIKNCDGDSLAETEWLPLEIQDDIRRGKITKQRAVEIQMILNQIIPPKLKEINGDEYIEMVSPENFTRAEIMKLHLALNKKLTIHQARPKGVDVVKRKLFQDCFNELIRQETIQCAERGLLLLRIRNEMNMTLAAFYALYESGRNYGIRTAVNAEKDDDTVTEMEELSKECAHLREQILIMKESIETSKERHDWSMSLEEMRHKREMTFYNQLDAQLQAQLEGVIPKKSV